MKIIWTLTLLMIPGVLGFRVTGYSGGGVSITCRYKTKYRNNAKYFCKGEWSECKNQIKTKTKNKWVDSGRFSLFDNTSAAVFTVTFRDLREEDNDIYYCGVERSGLDPYTEVKLNVISGQKISAVSGYSGGNVIINYKYEMSHMNHMKYIYKTVADGFLPLINTKRAAEWTHVGRFSVHDDRSARLLRVFITDLNLNDSGEYKIIVQVSEDYSFFSEFLLNIIDADCCEKSISLSAAAGTSVNISCKYPGSHSADVKFICRRSGSDLCAEETFVKESRRWSAEGQIQLYDDRKQRLLTGTISHVTPRHSAEYWCGVQSDQEHKSFITRVLLRVTDTDVSKTTSTNDVSSSSSSSSSSSVFKASTSSFTSESPLVLQDSSLIISLVLVLLVLIIVGVFLLVFCKKIRSRASDLSSQSGAGKHELDSHTACVYEDIKDSLPTNPSVSPDCVYATVQKESQTFITSAEDLNYAVVNFQKDCPDRVRSRNDQDYTEYAAINYLNA
ncbi:uncharacterized protein LOC122350712 [Puntigrus tetrazona]|uniref:uncharacterized protein LOC122350712 n=1 Tax=Puntigrus tetrazona TaxID=1606681 RepID=UPI001C8AA847|nr:uncharacterized protein LOC122350712 [Puntigrus tetrazona]